MDETETNITHDENDGRGSVRTGSPDGVEPLRADEIAEVRRRLDQPADGGGNRFVWFLIGFVAALISVAVAAFVFLAVSDQDEDGNLDVPEVDVSVDG